MDQAKHFVAEHFERLLVVGLVASIVGIHWFIDYKVAFLSFYYLPVIVAGFQLGRRGGTFSAVFIVTLVLFFQGWVGLAGRPGLFMPELLTLIPWGGFLILTGYLVGQLGDQRRERLTEVTGAYMTVLELLTFHIESSERHSRGHSFRVAARAVSIADALRLRDDDIEHIRVAALLHELPPDDPRIARMFEHFPGGAKTVPVVESMRSALDIVSEYVRYYELVGDWPVDHMRIRMGTKILAVADAFETLQLHSTNRVPMSVWGALEEIERGEGTTFATKVVSALRSSVTPARAVDMPLLASV
jgi:hypothetical protein